MTPSFMGLMATMLPGVRPSISLASLPTASTRPLILLIATMDGSLTTMPLPRAYTQVFAVPRSIARSFENSEKNEPRPITEPTVQQALGVPFRDMNAVLASVLDPVHGAVRGL